VWPCRSRSTSGMTSSRLAKRSVRRPGVMAALAGWRRRRNHVSDHVRKCILTNSPPAASGFEVHSTWGGPGRGSHRPLLCRPVIGGERGWHCDCRGGLAATGMESIASWSEKPGIPSSDQRLMRKKDTAYAGLLVAGMRLETCGRPSRRGRRPAPNEIPPSTGLIAGTTHQLLFSFIITMW
jgi:hypothetical protein